MGWAKYYEDNISICIGRMEMKDSISAIYKLPSEAKTSVKNAPDTVVKQCYDTVERPKNQNGRRGLELTFFQEPEKRLLIKLCLNGWWLSKGNGCWCNFDTAGNRKYAQSVIAKTGAHLSMVNA